MKIYEKEMVEMKTNEMAALAVLAIIGIWTLMSVFAPGAHAAAQVQANSGYNQYAQPSGANANAGAGANAGTGSNAQGGNGQQITIPIKVVNGYYDPREIRVKQGTKVRLELDPSSFVGCMSIFNIWGLGIKKQVSAGDNVVEFAASTPGTYKTSCNMGMGDGRFIVEPSDGSAAPAINTQAAPTGGSCGGGSGGCGCGGRAA